MWASTGTGRWRVLLFGVGVAAVGVGAALTLRPFSSNALTFFVAASLILAGLSELIGSVGMESPGRDRLAGGLLLAAGVVAAVAPGLTVRGIAIVVGVGTLLRGLARVSAGWRSRVEERYAALVGGLAVIVFGSLALAWPDVTIPVVGLLVGPVAIVFGARQALRAVRGSRPAKPPSTSRPSRLAARSASWRGTAVRLAPGARQRAGAPGFAGDPVLLHVVGRAARPSGRASAPANDHAGHAPGIASASHPPHHHGPDREDHPGQGLVVVSARRPGRGRSCSGSTARPAWRRIRPVDSQGPVRRRRDVHPDQVLARGWVLVAPDYLGLGASPPHPYLVGVPKARSALDAVRAARQLASIKLSDQTVVWAHSQGGGAALWTGSKGRARPRTFPLSGVAALAPASDLTALANGLETSKAGMLFASLMVAGNRNAYPDVAFNDHIRDSAQKVVRSVVGRCLSEPATLLSLPAVLTGEKIFSRHLGDGPLGTRLAQSVPNQVTQIPTLIGRAKPTPSSCPRSRPRFAGRLCQAGEKLEYRTYPGFDHVPLVEPNSPLIPYVLSWTRNRFQGAAAPSNC